MMIGYAGDHPELNSGGGWEGTACEVQCVVNLYGPTDLTFDFARDHALVQAFMPATYAEDPEIYAEASPITHVDASDPPTLTIHGTLDTLVGIQHGDALAEKLEQLGVPYLYDRVEGWPHVLDMEKRLHERTKYLMFRFLDTYLPVRGESATD
jgi:dipeptidyl aminopeptidase/acylaminoacyl peptidase